MTFLDPVMAAQKSEQEARLPFIVPEEFWIDYEPQPDGTRKAVEWVRWVKKGMQTPATCVEKVSRLSKPSKTGQFVPEWIVLKSYYESWKAGEAAPVNGTPLAAWPGATPQLVKALAPANIRSIEDLAEMEDSAIQRLAIPGLREKQKQSRAFLEAQKTTALVSGEIVEVRERNTILEREVAELRGLIERFAIKADQDNTKIKPIAYEPQAVPERAYVAPQEQAAKPKRGRPPKIKSEAA